MTDIKRMVCAMVKVEKFLGNKGRFVGDMVHIGIADLAEIADRYRWRKIDEEPPPKVGEDILVRNDNKRCAVAEWDDKYEWWIVPEYLSLGGSAPTHWMPIPTMLEEPLE